MAYLWVFVDCDERRRTVRLGLWLKRRSRVRALSVTLFKEKKGNLKNLLS
jgi:hypothetical protein